MELEHWPGLWGALNGLNSEAEKAVYALWFSVPSVVNGFG